MTYDGLVGVDDVGVRGGEGKRDERCSDDSKKQLNLGIPATVVGGDGGLIGHGDFEDGFKSILVI